MARKKHSAEQIIGYLREAEVLLAKSSTSGQLCRKIGITEHTYYRWRKEYGSLSVNQAKRLKEVEKENTRPRKPASTNNLATSPIRHIFSCRPFFEKSKSKFNPFLT